ncbi:MAG: gliding motility-associated C-terminal domain-containing protein [Chitinophagales bacterium]
MRKLYFLLLLLCYTFGSYAQNYTVLGNASSLSGCNCFQLTPDADDQAGAIFQNTPINLNNSFDYTFNVFLGCNGSNGADGICFVLTSNPNGLGNQGEGLGYAGGNQPYSIAIEFDTWANGSPANDPSYDHIGIESGGQYNHNLGPAVSALPSQAVIDDCNWHTVRIVWDVNTNTLSVYFDGNLRQSIVIPNMVGNYFGGNPVVNWGWSGATGGGSNTQQVCVTSTSNWVAGTNYQSCSPTMQFSDVSTSNLGSVQSWSWNFGDGGTSTLQNPTHTFAGNGTYSVTLTITDVTGCTYTYAHNVTITAPITLSSVPQAPPCNGGTNGNIIASSTGGFGASAGYGGYQYTWSNGTVGPNLVGVGAGTYTVSVTDGVCSASAAYTLQQPPPLTASTSSVNASCGANNGSVSIAIGGGTGPYSNTWVPGAPFVGTTYTNLAPGLYTANPSDANGCSALLTYTATVGNSPCGYSFSSAHTDVTCFGGNNGVAWLIATGGPSPVITWSNGVTNDTIYNLTSGTYTWNYSDGTGYSTSGQVTVNQPGAAMVASLATVDMSCASTNDGQAIASVVSGGTSPYTYAWSNGAGNTAVATNLSAGNITVTVTDAGGCTATATGSVTGPPTLSLTITPVDDSCYQSQTGSAMANPSGGNPPYLYNWSNISSAQNNLSLGVGTYTVTVTDDKGCTITGSTTINQPASAVTHTISATNVNCFGGATGTITVNASGGSPAYTYTWSPATASGSNPTGLTAGQYNLTITDTHNCQNKDSITITQPAAALSVTTAHTDVSCYGGNNGTVTISISGGTGPYTYQGNPIPVNPLTIPNLVANTYSGTVADANGCTASASETVSQPGVQSLTVNNTNNSCNGGNTGTASANFVNATGSVTYSWSNGASGTPINNLVANTYTVTATDANTCTVTGTVTVTEPVAPVMTVNVINATCFGSNGGATASPSGGTAPFSYVWSSGGSSTATASLPAGAYTVTATDATSCNQTASFSITEPADINIQPTPTNINCFGDATGAISLNVSGGTGPNYTYAWTNNVSNTSSASLLTAGTYDITVTDQASCNKTISVTLTEPAAALSPTITPTNITCFGANNGTITVTTVGGTAPYTYTWNPNVSSGNSATSLSANTYNVTVTDNKGCSVFSSVTITEPNQPLTLAPAQTNLSCYQINDGLASVSASGGSFPYTYVWTNNVSTGNSASGLAAGNYGVTVTDNNGCTSSNNFIITEPSQLVVTETHTNEPCFGDAVGTMSVTANGGTPGYTYNWNPNVSSGSSATALSAGAYTVTVLDANGCNVVKNATITEPAALTASATPSPALCFGQSSGSIITTVNGGTPAYGYSATNDGVNFVSSGNGQFNNLAAGMYTVLVVDNNNCVASDSTLVTEPQQLSDNVSVTDATCYGYANGIVSVTPVGGTAAYTFNLSDGQTNTSGLFNGLTAGNYDVTITDAGGCTVTDVAVVSEPDSVSIQVTPTPAEVKLGDALSLTTNTNQSGNLTYTWTPQFGLSCYDCANPSFDGVYSQVYTVVAVNDSGCSGTATFAVTVIPDYGIFTPNAFTPNGDGENDYWQLFTALPSIKQIEVQVFNRIGELVFESTDLNFKWDGTYKGKYADNGVYVYQLKVVWLNNHADSGYKGTITLMR